MDDDNLKSSDKTGGADGRSGPDSDTRASPGLQVSTRLVHAGRSDPRTVASPVYHASTVLFGSYREFREREAAPNDRKHMYYGRMGTPTTRSLEDALRALDDSVGAVLAPSGVGSISDILSCFLHPGDQLLMVDSVYGPTRRFCDNTLAARGVTTRYYSPSLGADLEPLISDATRLIFMESPGSGTFEVQDVPAITRLARRRGVLTAIDNTWATPLLFNPLDHDVDLVMQSGTKYLNGHADCLYGVTTSRDEKLCERLRHYSLATGSHLAPDDAMLALRGLRTLPIRLEAHDRSARRVAAWLSEQPRVLRLLHPAWPSCPGHELFERDFRGASGLFSIVVNVGSESGLQRLIDALSLFGVGYSWGGFESLCLPMVPPRSESSQDLDAATALLRLHIGLEHPDDLIAELSKALATLD